MHRKQTVMKLSFGLMSLVLLVFIGCDRVDLGIIDNNPVKSDAVDPELVRANTRFGFKLLNELRRTEQDQNTLISPFSVSLALAMVRNGAVDETERAMRNALQLQGLDPQSLNANYVYLQNTLQAPNSDVTLSVANSLWGAAGIEFDPGFLNRNRQFLDTEISNLDFTDPNNVSTINESVSDSTDGRISNIIEAIAPSTVVCLISGIYFKGSWQEEFEVSQTLDKPFYLANGGKKQVPMMHKTDWFSYYAGGNFQAIELLYGEGRMGMYIFLPNRNIDLNTFLADLHLQNWEIWMSRLFSPPTEVRLVLPKFELRYSAGLERALGQLGMGIAFDGSQADFSRMRVSPVPVFISYLDHHAIVEVNEEGTEAATGTYTYLAEPQAEDAVPLDAAPPPIPFIVDRPFFFAIRDNQTQTVLFMGVVADPGQQGRGDDIVPAPFPEPPLPEPLPEPLIPETVPAVEE